MFMLMAEAHGEINTILCEDAQIYKAMALVEKSRFVTRYKIQKQGMPTFTEDNLKYSFPGYMFPAGKAHWKFSWEKD